VENCQRIQEMLIKKSVKDPGYDAELVLAHVAHCESCRQFQQHLKAMETAAGEQPGVELPGRLLARLLKRMRSKARSQRLRLLFSRKMVVYQATMAAVLFLLLLLTTSKLREPRTAPGEQYMPADETVRLNVLTVKQIHQIVDSQKVGMNLSQDTALAKILFTL